MLALGNTISADPNHARAHLRLASHYITMVEEQRTSGKNPHMPLAQIRQAALGAAFQSQSERADWLSRPGVLGDHRRHLDKALAHARHSMRLCPLQGIGYIHLAQLGYLAGDDSAASSELFAQALVVRPHEARIHEAVGIEAWLAGDQQSGLDHWKHAFGLDRKVQRRILRRLAAAGLSAQVIIQEFQPDWESLVYMKDLYKQSLPKTEYQVVLAGYAQAAHDRAGHQDGTDAVTSWLQAAGAYRQLGKTTEVQACYEKALAENPASLTARLAFGRWLYSQKQFAAALEHLNWSARQQPDDEQLARLITACRKAAARN
jgi:tetratricopeptide (TPR) repeat protein